MAQRTEATFARSDAVRYVAHEHMRQASSDTIFVVTDSQVEATIMSAIRSIVERRSGDEIAVGRTSNLYDDLSMDSLEVAELSSVLEDDLGSDPYSAGLVPQTVAEILSFYAGAAP